MGKQREGGERERESKQGFKSIKERRMEKEKQGEGVRQRGNAAAGSF